MKLELQNLSFSYGTQEILHDLSFSVAEGEFVSLLGPSGCGKSTILKLLTGVLTPSDGSIRADGNEIHGITGHFAYMPQNDLLFPWKTILDNVCLYGEIHGSLARAREEALKNFPAFGLTGYETSYPSALSGGMRQRAALIRTLLPEPELLLLDEPFSALDYQTRLTVSDDIGQILRHSGKTALLVTHDLSEAISLSDRIIVLSRRPATVSTIIPVTFSLEHDTPLNRRNAPEFKTYFNQLWKELNQNETLA